MVKNFTLIFLLAFSILSAQSIVWNAPVVISTAAVDASDPQVSMDGSGNSVAIWLEGGFVKASNLPNGGSWTAPVTISGSGASSLHLKVDPSGNATAIWLEGGVVKAVSHPFGGSWSAETSLSGTGTATSPVLDVDPSGNAVAVWVQTNVSTVIQSSTQLFGGSWQGSPDTITTGSSLTSPDNPAVSIGSGGTVVAIWHALSGSNDGIVSNSKTLSGGVWGTPINVNVVSTSFNFNYPKVIVDGSGNANATAFRFNRFGSAYTNVNVIASQLPAGSSAWSAIPTVITITAGNRNPADLNLRMRIDNAGNVIALWTTAFDGQNFSVETAVLPAGETWVSGGELILDNLYALSADLTVNTIGDAVSVYMFYDGTFPQIQAINSDVASSVTNYWVPPQTISQASTNNGYPRVASALMGLTMDAVAVWIYFDGSNNRIASSFGTASAVSPPSNVTIVQNSTNFGVFIDYHNTVSWTASSDPNLIAYVIYRNGIVVEQLSSSFLQFIDHNQVQNGSITYGVAALNTDNSQSQIITATFP